MRMKKLCGLCAALCVLLAGCASSEPAAGPEPSSSAAEISSSAEPSSSQPEEAPGEAAEPESMPESSSSATGPQEEPEAAPSEGQQPEEAAPEASSSSEAVSQAPEVSSEGEQPGSASEAPAGQATAGQQGEDGKYYVEIIAGGQTFRAETDGPVELPDGAVFVPDTPSQPQDEKIYVGDKYYTGPGGFGDYLGYSAGGYYGGIGSEDNIFGDFRGQDEPDFDCDGKDAAERMDAEWSFYYGGWVYTLDGYTDVIFPGGSSAEIG